MTRLPDHFTRRPDHRAGDMAQLPEPEAPSYRARMWRRMIAGLVVFWLAVLALIFT